MLCIGRCYALADVIAMYCCVDGKPQRQMLSPLLHQGGRCYCHSFVLWQMVGNIHCMFQHLKMADAIAKWQMECYYHGGRWNSHRVNMFYFKPEVFNRTSSQMCGRWYLSMFLFRDGLLTLIYRAYLMVLMRFWSSFPTILKLSMLIL